MGDHLYPLQLICPQGATIFWWRRSRRICCARFRSHLKMMRSTRSALRSAYSSCRRLWLVRTSAPLACMAWAAVAKQPWRTAFFAKQCRLPAFQRRAFLRIGLEAKGDVLKDRCAAVTARMCGSHSPVSVQHVVHLLPLRVSGPRTSDRRPDTCFGAAGNVVYT